MAGKRRNMMRPFGRLLSVTTGMLGLLAFIAGLINGQEPAMVLGFGAYIVGLTTASLLAWRLR
jgi:hypothetical protein